MKIRDKNTFKYINSDSYLQMFGCYDHVKNNTFLVSKLQKLRLD